MGHWDAPIRNVRRGTDRARRLRHDRQRQHLHPDARARADVGKLKTRTVSGALEDLGLPTRIVERAFEASFRPVISADPARDEPTTALAGFDAVEPRRQLSGARFNLAVDAGLGAGPVEYLDMVIHTFPAAGDPSNVFSRNPARRGGLPAPYEAEVQRRLAAGEGEAAVRCGMLDILGITVGAAFVGTIAASIVLADVLRRLHDGDRYSVVSLDLRSPNGIQAVRDGAEETSPTPRFTRAIAD